MIIYILDTIAEMIQGILHTKNYSEFEIRSDGGELLHSFSGAKNAKKCLPGDHVKWIDSCELELRDEYPPIVGTIELTNKSKYGLTSRGVPIYLFTPYDKRFPHFIVGCSEKDTTRNKIGVIKFEDWSQNSTFPRGILQQILGNSGDFDAELQALIWQASPVRYPKGEWVPETKDTPRRVLTGDTFNIDPPGCKDIDDVLTFEEVGERLLKIIITISDVATYVQDGTVEDIFASLIGQTLYVDGKAVRPMLPAQYSELACSLLPRKKSYGVSLEILWNNVEGRVESQQWYESEFENNCSYTYEEFQESDCKWKPVLQEFASYLAGEAVTDSHKWIEECMKFYNVEAAKLLKSSGMGILRRHSAPKMELLESFRDHPDLEFLAYNSAEYCLASEESVHYGLSTDTYTHITSPIRRYADLMNQRVLKTILGKKEEYIVPISMFDMNYRQKLHKRFYRDVELLKAIRDNTEFEALIVQKSVKEDNLCLKLYVKEWKKFVNARYKCLDENTIITPDEKRTIRVELFHTLHIKCVYLYNTRSWKDRILFEIKESK